MYTPDRKSPRQSDRVRNMQAPWKFSKRNAVQNAPRCELTSDPWHNCRTKIEFSDKARCDAWNDDISNLITFTGLFSAVVTAFLIESYKRLQVDPSSTTGTVFTPSKSDININILWFFSLSLSLSVALIGLTCKQWISQYQRRPSLSPKDALRLRQWRYKGMERWQMPKIIALLPMIQQVSVFLFLGGLFNFLHDLNWTVSLSVLWVLCTTAGFSLLTSILPAVWMAVARDSIYPCPYKSPQSWLLFLLLHPLTQLRLPTILTRHNQSQQVTSKIGDRQVSPPLRYPNDTVTSSSKLFRQNGALADEEATVPEGAATFQEAPSAVNNATSSDEDGLPLFLFGQNWSFVEKHVICSRSQRRKIFRKNLRRLSLAWIYKHLSHDPEVENSLLRCLSTLPTADAEEVINDDLIPLITRLDPNDDSDPASEETGLPLWLQNYHRLFGERVMQSNQYLIPELFIRKLYEDQSKEEEHHITVTANGDTTTQTEKFKDKIKLMVGDCELESQIYMLLDNDSKLSSAVKANLENFLKHVPGLLPDLSGSTPRDKGKRHQTGL